MSHLILQDTAQFPGADGNLHVRDRAYKMQQVPSFQFIGVLSLLKSIKDKPQSMNRQE